MIGQAERMRSTTLALRLATLAGSAVLSLPVLAHGGDPSAESSWWAWQVTPDIAIATLIPAALYASGMYRLRGRGASPSAWRNASFFGGLALIFLALQSPLDAVADHSFFVHQIQHLLLHAGPMLVMLAAPQGALLAGSPAALRRYVIGPLTAAKPLRAAFGFLTRPAIATTLLVASVYFWQWPSYHDLAVRVEGVHYVMHVSMLAAALLFFWTVFDPRPAPWGVGAPARMLMVWTALTAGMLLGALTTFKESVLYGAYEAGRLRGLDALADERLGGLVMWIPGCMVYVVAALVVLGAWGTHEAKRDERRARGLANAGVPACAASGSGAARSAGNRALALKLAVIAAAVFAIVIGVGVTVVAHADGAGPLPEQATLPGGDR